MEYKMKQKISREKSVRKLIKSSLIVYLLCFIPSFLYANIVKDKEKSPLPTNKKTPEENINPSGWNEKKLLKTFEETNQGAKQYLAAKYKDKKLAAEITEKALQEFKSLVIELPNVGGEKNIDAEFIPIASWYLSYYRAMKPHGMDAEDVGRMIYDLNQIAWKHYTNAKAKTTCNAFFSGKNKEKLKEWAKWTQKRQYPANWIMEYVPGEDEEFDFGYNYTHCGVCLYLNSYDAIELAPFVCLNDFVESRALDTGLHRTKTIATGDKECNFRFKKGREVTQNWNTEIGKIRARIKTGNLYHP
jgi:hypothetical protein